MLFIGVAVKDSIYNFSAYLANLSNICTSTYPRIRLNHRMIANANGSLNGSVRANGNVLTYINWPILGIEYTARFNTAIPTNEYLVFINKVNTFI